MLVIGQFKVGPQKYCKSNERIFCKTFKPFNLIIEDDKYTSSRSGY